MGKAGLSWKRTLGVTKTKQSFSRKTGIPLTKSGRQRKIGKIATGGGCLIPIVLIISLIFLFILIL